MKIKYVPRRLSLQASILNEVEGNLVESGFVLVPVRLRRRGVYPERVEGLLAMTQGLLPFFPGSLSGFPEFF
jgi:hypothetical protein